MTSCSCVCHGSGTAHMRPCSVPGGCGHLHRDDGPDCSDHRTPAQPHCVLPHRAWPDGCERLATATVGLACYWHRNRLDLLIEELHDGYASLALIEVAGTSPRDSSPRTGRTKNPSPPAPANLDVLGLRDVRSRWDSGKRIQAGNLPSVPAMLLEWLEQVRDGRGLTETYEAVRNGVKVQLSRPMTLPKYPIAQMGMLKRHHDWIAEQEWVPDYLAELTELRQAINSALQERTYWVLGSCYLTVERDVADKCVCECHAGAEACSIAGGCKSTHIEYSDCTGRILRKNGELHAHCTAVKGHVWVTAQDLAYLELTLSRQTGRTGPGRVKRRLPASRDGNGWMAS